MSTCRRLLTVSRRLLIVLALLIGVLAPAAISVPTTAAVASESVQASYIVETYYYSDSSKTVEVGYSIRDCRGWYFLSGQTSPYYTVVREPCGW